VRLWLGLIAFLFTGTIAVSLFVLAIANRSKAKVAQNVRAGDPSPLKPSEPKTKIPDASKIPERDQSDRESNRNRAKEDRGAFDLDDEGSKIPKGEKQSKNESGEDGEPTIAIAPPPAIPFPQNPDEKRHPVQKGKAKAGVREPFDPVPAEVGNKDNKAPAEKVRTLTIEEVVRQMNRGTAAANRAIALAAETGNQLKVAKVREEWVKKWNDKWAGKKLRVSGTINSIGPYTLLDRTPDDEGKLVICMYGAEPAKAQTDKCLILCQWEVAFIFSDEDDQGKVKEMSRGQKVTIEGTVASLNWSLRLNECHIIGRANLKKQKQ
jgi:hypothetical protein